MWWCSPVVGEGTREAEIVGSNPNNAGKNRATCDFRRERGGKNILFLFLFKLQIFILACKSMILVTYVLT